MKKKLALPNVTLLAATSIEIDMTQLALRISFRNIKFGAVKLLSSSLPSKKYSDIEYISIPTINNIADYNRIIIEDLHKYFKTSHCLVVQPDSFVVDSDLWKDEFLQFDYIGAPWSEKLQVNPSLILNMKKNCVGNGGFSLRSRKLVESTAKINFASLLLILTLFTTDKEITLSFATKSIPLMPFDDLPLNSLNFFDMNRMHFPSFVLNIIS